MGESSQAIASAISSGCAKTILDRHGLDPPAQAGVGKRLFDERRLDHAGRHGVDGNPAISERAGGVFGNGQHGPLLDA